MATIQDYLNNILKAVYGKDVRQSIHDAIYQCYQDGKAGQLDLTARTKIAEIEKNIQEILESGTTAETVQEKVQSVINSMVSDGMLANMTIADGSITKEKLAPDLEIEVTDESITTQKVADRAITMEKTDFYFIDSVELSGDWFSKGYNPSNTVVPRITFGTYEEVMENMPEVFTAVFKNQNDYVFSGISCGLSYSYTYSAYIPYETGNLVIDDERWWYISVKKSDLKAEYDNHPEAAFGITAANVANKWDGSEYYVISGALTEDVIRSNFVIKQISSDFVSAVSYAMAKKEEIIKYVAMAYGVPIVDMFHEFPSVFIPSNRERYWNADKLHLSVEGYQKIVDAVEQKMIELFS